MTTVSQTLQWLCCSNSKFLLHSAGEIWKHDEFDLWPFQADFTLTQLFKTKAVTTLLFIRRTESLKSHLWDPNGFEHFSQKASVVKDPQISWNNLVLQHGSSRNIYPVTMIGYDDDSTLMNKTINEWKTDRNVTYSCNLCSKSKVIVKKYSWVALTGWWPVQGVSHLPPCGSWDKLHENCWVWLKIFKLVFLWANMLKGELNILCMHYLFALNFNQFVHNG